jgi:hypothetical protein
MRMLEKNKRTVHVAKRESEGGVEVYRKPVAVRVSFRNAARVTGSADAMSTPGEVTPGLLIAVVDHRTAEHFKEFDKLYVFTKPPLAADVNASGADYAVNAVIPALNITEVHFKRVSR